MSEGAIPQPLVLLDVDGVLHDREAMRQIRIASNPQATADRLGMAVVVSHGRRLAIPGYMPGLIQQIDSVAEIWWCTTWRHRANDDIAKHLGIGPLPVIDDGTRSVGIDWKTSTAAPKVQEARAAGRSVYWIEDFAGVFPEIDEVTFIDTGSTLVLQAAHLPSALRS